jgi:hypothetical protein
MEIQKSKNPKIKIMAKNKSDQEQGLREQEAPEKNTDRAFVQVNEDGSSSFKEDADSPVDRTKQTERNEAIPNLDRER